MFKYVYYCKVIFLVCKIIKKFGFTCAQWNHLMLRVITLNDYLSGDIISIYFYY